MPPSAASVTRGAKDRRRRLVRRNRVKARPHVCRVVNASTRSHNLITSLCSSSNIASRKTSKGSACAAYCAAARCWRGLVNRLSRASWSDRRKARRNRAKACSSCKKNYRGRGQCPSHFRIASSGRSPAGQPGGSNLQLWVRWM